MSAISTKKKLISIMVTTAPTKNVNLLIRTLATNSGTCLTRFFNQISLTSVRASLLFPAPICRCRRVILICYHILTLLICVSPQLNVDLKEILSEMTADAPENQLDSLVRILASNSTEDYLEQFISTLNITKNAGKACSKIYLKHAGTKMTNISVEERKLRGEQLVLDAIQHYKAPVVAPGVAAGVAAAVAQDNNNRFNTVYWQNFQMTPFGPGGEVPVLVESSPKRSRIPGKGSWYLNNEPDIPLEFERLYLFLSLTKGVKGSNLGTVYGKCRDLINQVPLRCSNWEEDQFYVAPVRLDLMNVDFNKVVADSDTYLTKWGKDKGNGHAFSVALKHIKSYSDWYYRNRDYLVSQYNNEQGDRGNTNTI